MKYLAILLVCAVGFAAAATYGDYVPKAFFVIDENGNPSPAQPITAETLNRVRRQIQPFQPFGQTGFPFAPFPNIQPGQGQGTFVSSSQTLNSRFGDDEPVVHGQSTIIHSSGNKFTQTNTVLRPDGTSYSNQQSGRVKRQQSQTQSQGGQGGNQIQNQSQNAPGGLQHQTQSQGQNLEPIATPAANHQSDNRNQGSAVPHGNQGSAVPHGNQGSAVPHGNQGSGVPQGNQGSLIPQGNEQQYAPQYEQGQTENRNQQSYPQPQANYQPGFAPFGFGAFGPQGFPQAGFGFPQAGFGFPQQGFGGVGFGAPFGFQQPGFGGAGFGQPGFGGAGIQPVAGIPITGNRLDSRFSDDDASGNTGGTTSFTSNNGVFHSTSSVLGPDGKVITRHQSGRI